MTILEQNACNAIISMAKKDEPDYWTRLEHQYAGMAMQGMMIEKATQWLFENVYDYLNPEDQERVESFCKAMEE